MIDFNQIVEFYPAELRHFKKNIFREYLQCKILEIIYNSPFGKYLTFMGGTAIHLLYGSQRFSEDLDFDNRGIKQSDFKKLGQIIKEKLILEGYKIETRLVFKKAFRLYLTFHHVLHDNKISPHKDSVLLIRVDAQPQNFNYAVDRKIVNKFDVFSQFFAVPIDILLAQKISCLFSRPRLMGRDFYDIVFLSNKTKPNFAYLTTKLKIKNGTDLKTKLLEKCRALNYEQLSKDTEAFLFSQNEKKKILFFYEYLKSLDF